jgi:phage protein D
MISDLLDAGTAPPALTRPRVTLSFGAGGGGGGLGGLAEAAGLSSAGAGLEAGLVRLRLHRGGPDLPAAGDEGTIELVAEDAQSSFACTIDLVEQRSDGLRRLTASNGGRVLARARSEISFADQTPGDIIDALADEVGVTAGVGAAGEKLPRYVADSGRSLLDHVARLAATAGRLAYFDDDGALALADDSTAGEAVAQLLAGTNILDMRIAKRAAEGKVVVHGEGAPDQGKDAWAWIRKASTGLDAEAGTAPPERGGAAPWARSRDAATDLADARQRAIAREASLGRFLVSAVPQAAPGAVVELSGVEGNDGPWLVTEVDLTFDPARGMISEIRAAPAGGGGGGSPLGGLL